MDKEERVYGLRNENLPAFPTEISYGDQDFTGMPIVDKKHCYGLTKREYLLGQAINGFMARHGAVDFSQADVTRIIDSVDLLIQNM